MAKNEHSYGGARLDTGAAASSRWRALFAPLVFAPLVFAPLVFAPLIFAPLVFAPLVFAPLVFAPGFALAGEVDDEDEAAIPLLEDGAPSLAQARYLLGRQLYVRGDIEGAEREFSTAFDAFPKSAKLAFNLGRTRERLGKIKEAVESYRAYLALSPQAEDKAAVEAVIGALEARILAALAEVELASEPPGALVHVDSDPAPLPEPTPTRTRLAAGEHVLRFTLEGHRPVIRSLRTEVATPVVVHVVLPVEEVSPPSRLGNPLAWALVGAGAVTTTIGGVFLSRAADSAESAGALAPTEANLPRYSALRDDFSRQRVIGWAGIGAGAAMLGGGVAAWLWPRTGESPKPAVTVDVDPAGVTLRGVFP